jgi:DNA-directed RNA polymerase specialized sigma24 family protein
MATARVFKTKEEFAHAISLLSRAEKARLRQASIYIAQVASLDAEDLLQEALVRGFQGTRRWPDHVDIVSFVAMVMKSLVSAERKKTTVRPERDPDDEGDPDVFADENPEGLGQRADDILIAEEERQALTALFEGDDEAQLIVEGLLGGVDGEQLREMVGLDETEYASKRRKIRRTLNKAYGAGKNSK